MKRYDSYKNANIFGFSIIPSHWVVMPMRAHFSFEKGLGITKADLKDSGIPVLSYGQIHSKFNSGVSLTPELIRYVDNSFLQISPQCLVNIGDFVFADTSEDVEGSGNCAFNDSYPTLFAGYHTVIARPFGLKFLSFVAYLFQSKEWKSQIQKSVNAVKVFSIGKHIIKRAHIILPPTAEQEAIAAFLNDKIAKIDNYITEREKEIITLCELKQAEIASVVTRGMTPDVPMHDSGIPWIGQIPAHWEVETIRSLFRLASEKNTNPDATLLSLSQYNGISLKRDAGKTGMFEAESTIGYNVVHKGQFVMNIMLAWNGSYAVSEYDGVISPAYCVFDFIRPCNKKYFDLLLRQPSYAAAFKTQSKGLIDSRLRLYPQYFKSFPIIIPPIEEQNQIVEYINNKTEKIDRLVSNLTAEIDRLKEFKQKLISDTVTGQIDVRDYKPQPLHNECTSCI